MPRDLFAAVTAAPSRTARGRVVPWSVVLHVLVLAAIVIAPLVASVELPPLRSALTYTVALVKLPPPPPVIGPAQAPARARTPVTAPSRDAAPLVAPDRIVPESLPTVPGGDGVPEGFGEPGGTPGGVPGGLPEIAAAPAIPPPPARPPRVGGEIRAPVKIRDVRPVYPTIAQQAGIQGVVIIDAVIGPDGRVSQVRVLRSIPMLDQAALDAVRQWVFTPTRLNGEPIAVAMTITVHFTLAR